jgi:hypothetical protein
VDRNGADNIISFTSTEWIPHKKLRDLYSSNNIRTVISDLYSSIGKIMNMYIILIKETLGQQSSIRLNWKWGGIKQILRI